MSVDPNRVKHVFLAATDRPVAERPAFLATACAGDPDLRAAVDRLLTAHDSPDARLTPDAPTATVGSDEPETTGHGPDAPHGTVLAGKYELIEEIGSGGMGTVWMAQQTEPVKRAVAVKLVKAGMDSRAVLARFDAERQALALMDHPNIATVFDAGATADGRPFFVMELVKGVPITQFCDDRKLTPRQRLELFVPVCGAIQHAHQKGVIHRDIKPSNVLVALYDDTAVPKVIDFGVAKAAGSVLTDQTFATGFGAVVGTPEYMSPEQASFNNLDIDTRSDVYALGVLLYELLAGAPPFGQKEFEKAGLLEILRVVREVEPPQPSTKLSTSAARPTHAANRGTEPKKLAALLRGELDWIVMKALEKDRARRYDTAAGLAADVRRYLADEPVTAGPPNRWYGARKFVKRNRGAVLAAALVLVALVAGVAGTTWGLVRALDAEATAEEEGRKAREQAVKAREQEAIAKTEQRKAHEHEQTAKAERDRAVAAQRSLRLVLTRLMADRILADMQRIAAVGAALAATVEHGDGWDEKRFVGWMNRVLESEPDILGLCIAFEPGRFNPAPDPATAREPFAPLLPLGLDAWDPYRDGYSLYVRHRRAGNRFDPVAEALKRKYRYRTQGWYANTLNGKAHGWEEPSYDASWEDNTQMVAFTLPLRLRDRNGTIGVLCLDLSLAYFQRLDAWLRDPNFGPGSYGFVLSEQGKVISHPHLRAPGAVWDGKPFPDARHVWRDAAFSDTVGRMLAHTGEDVGQATGTDPATGRRSQFLYARFTPANWVFVAVIPEVDP